MVMFAFMIIHLIVYIFFMIQHWTSIMSFYNIAQTGISVTASMFTYSPANNEGCRVWTQSQEAYGRLKKDWSDHWSGFSFFLWKYSYCLHLSLLALRYMFDMPHLQLTSACIYHAHKFKGRIINKIEPI